MNYDEEARSALVKARACLDAATEYLKVDASPERASAMAATATGWITYAAMLRWEDTTA